MAPCALSIKRIFFQITSEKLKSMAIKIEALRTFVHVADAGNIKDAADVLGANTIGNIHDAKVDRRATLWGTF